MIRLDTHVVAWLHAGMIHLLSPTAVDAIESSQLLISPIVEMELTYLHEIGRLAVPGADIVGDLGERIGLEHSPVSLAAAARAAATMNWTRDPFDRLIAADAAAAGTRLLTKDDTILDHLPDAFW